MRLAVIPVKQILIEFNIRHKTQVKTWMRWYKNGEIHRFEQPVGKEYTFDKDPEYENKQAKLEVENRYL